MDGHEKADFILEQVRTDFTSSTVNRPSELEMIFTSSCPQMRLCQAQKDFVRTIIVSEKIDKELIEKPEYQDIKLRFYSQLSEFHTLKDKTLELCRCNLRMLHTPKIQADNAKLQEVFFF